MKKRVYLTVTIVSGVLAVPGYTINPYTGERETGKSAIDAGLGSPVSAGTGTLSSPKKNRGKGVLVGVAAGVVLGSDAGYYMGAQEVKLCDKMRGTGVNVTRSRDNIILNMPSSVTFGSSSTTLRPAGANTLIGVIMVLKEYPKTAVSVIGYADSTGGHDLNMRLLQQRADSVANALITQDVDVSRIRTQGLGLANPIISDSTTEGKAQSHRVEITLNLS